MNFDPNVQVGQVRVFADVPEPLVAAVVADRGIAGYRIVPVSPYRVPASAAEVAVGARVFQLWNACTAARRFAARSWVVDTLAQSDVDRLREGLRTSAAPALGDYERRHLALGGDFRPWSARFPKQAVRRRWGIAAWAAAAMLVVGLGTVWLLEGTRSRTVSTPRILTLRMERPERVPELTEPEGEPSQPAGPIPEVKVEVAVEQPSVRPPEPAPEVRALASPPKMAPTVPTRLSPLKRDAVVATRRGAGDREPEVVATLAWLKTQQRADGSWGEVPLKDTALAVLALMAHGETSDSAAYGPTLVKGVRYLSETPSDGRPRQERQLVACALCCASQTVRNPNIRGAAEKALAAIGDNRSVEAGRDWRALLDDLSAAAAPPRPAGSRMADARPEADSTAAAGILVLQLLK